MPGVTLSLLVLRTRRLDVARRFYETLGVDFHEEQHGAGPAHLAGRLGGLLLELYPADDGSEAVDASTRLGFVVANLTGVLDSLVERELSPSVEPRKTEWGLRAVVRDPDGRAVELYGGVE